MLLCELQSVCCCSCLNAGEHIKKSCLIIQVCFVPLHYLIWAQNIKATLLEPKQLVIQVYNLNKGAVVSVIVFAFKHRGVTYHVCFDS